MNRATPPTGWARNPDGSPGYTWNPLSGCRNHTPEGLCLSGLFPCYAWILAHGRLKPLYLANLNYIPAVTVRTETKRAGDPFYPRFWEERLAEMTKRNDRLYYDGKKTEYPISPRGIFVCDMGDLFGVGVPFEWTEKVLDEIYGNKGYDRFYILTKQAQRLPEFSPFPDNAWVGVTATTQEMLIDALAELHRIKATIKYISFEPLLEAMNGGECEGKRLDGLAEDIDWLIIGACTGTKEDMLALTAKYPHLTVMPSGKKWTAQPKVEDLREIVEAADQAGVKVFLKDNLKPLLENAPLDPLYWANVCNDEAGNERVDDNLRQEMPE